MALGSPMAIGTMADWSRTQVRAARKRRASSASSCRKVDGGSSASTDHTARVSCLGVAQVVAGDDGYGVGLEPDPAHSRSGSWGESTIRTTPSGPGGAAWLLRLPTIRSE